MSLSPIAPTEVRSKLAQIPVKRPRLERQANDLLLEEIQADCPGEHWTKTPSHQLSDDQLLIVLRIIIESVSIHRSWRENSDRPDILQEAYAAELTIKRCLQECWGDGDFSTVRHAGYYYFIVHLQFFSW